VDGLLPGFLGRAIARERAEEALESLADERGALVGAVGRVLHLVEVDGDRAGDAPEDVRRRKRFCERAVAAAVGGGVVGHAGRTLELIGTKGREVNPQGPANR
jgi:hypothetical protein